MRDTAVLGRAALLVAGGLFALSCGSLGSPNRPDPPEHSSESSAPQGTVIGAPGVAPTPTPTPGPGEPSPAPSATPDGSGCGTPLPPAIARMSVKIHIRGEDAWTLDSTPLVRDAAYCALIGFTDGRSECPVRPEGNPQRPACELYAVGRAKDTNRPGPTWYFNGQFCAGEASGCANHPENQYLLRVYRGGTFSACAQNGVCGEVVVDR